MPTVQPSLTMGIEEEYLLVDPTTRDLAIDPPKELMADCQQALGEQVMPEFLRAQIEIGTRVCHSVAEARQDLVMMRSTVLQMARKHGLALIAAGTHPFAQWNEQLHTDKERYHMLASSMQGLARRLLICGMHVHIGIEDEDLRIDMMNQVRYFLPHLLALSTSSPFWRGVNTGLMSYRLSVFDGLPRTGVPDRFESYGEYERLVNQMVRAGVIDEASKIWWDVRPSAKFPTLEMRMTDVCTRIDDTVTIAAFYVCIISMLKRLKLNNQRWRIYPRTLIDENRWLAQRHGTGNSMVDFGKGESVPFGELMEELIELVREDAERLDCVAEIDHARDIVARGTSAQRQLALFQEAQKQGADERQALEQVVDMLIEETAMGLDLPAADR